MKKIISRFFKELEQKNKRQLIAELLTVGNSIEESISLFEKVKSDFLFAMNEEQKRIRKETKLIDGLKQTKVHDSNFDKPLAEIETVYEIVKPK